MNRTFPEPRGRRTGPPPPHPSPFILPPSQKASSLITTLLVLVVLSTIVVAFMQSMSIERSVAKSALIKYKAEMVAQAGLNDFFAAVRPLLTNDLYIVVSATNANGTFTYVGNPTPTNNLASQIIYTPLFSGGVKVTNPTLTLPNISTLGGNTGTNIPPLPGYLAPVNTEWFYLTDVAGKTNGRYAYWVEDVAGYVDAQVAGNTNGPLSMHTRSNGIAPQEIALYVALDQTNTNGVSPDATKVIANRTHLLTAATVLQNVQTNLFANASRSVITSGIDDSERDLVPVGRGYASQGLAKTNINNFVSSSDVSGLSSYIATNLPLFASTNRSGAANGGSYLRNLAANIIDYADSDSIPLTGADYRGIDLYPFMTTYYQQFHWRNRTGGSTASASSYWYAKSGTWHGQIDVTTFVQLWNMHSKPISSGILEIHDVTDPSDSSNIYNRYSIYVAGNETQLVPEPVGTASKQVDFSAVPLQPNQFTVYQFGPVSYECDSGISTGSPRPNLTGASRPTISERDASGGIDHDDSNYAVTFNGRIVDRPGSSTTSRIDRKAGTLDREGVNTGPDWRGFVVGLRFDSSFPVTYETAFVLGDPRGNMFINWELAANDYDLNSSWWGRHFAYSLMSPPTGTWFGQETLPSVWPDGGANTQRAAAIFQLNTGSTPTDERLRSLKTPFDIPAASRPAMETNKAVSIISNAGAFTNILELGNIYDPIQWRPDWIAKRSGDTNVPADQSSMTNSWQSLESISMVPSAKYVVPGSLRVGRSEYKTLDQSGTRSAQLIEVLAATNAPRLSTRGRININTASSDALRSLVAGLSATNDPNSVPATIGFPNRGYMAQDDGRLFAETIISNRPFLTTAQLSWMTNSYGGFFGTTNQYATNAPSLVPVSWNDSAHEKFFAMIYNLSHVRSRHFRIWISADSFDERGKVRSRVNRVFQVFFKPDRTVTGEILKSEAVVTYESSF